jgi:hypothetical protein
VTNTPEHLARPVRHNRFPAIPEAKPTVESLVQVCTALKEAVEILTNQRIRGQGLTAAPSWEELVNMGVVKVDQVTALQDGRIRPKL